MHANQEVGIAISSADHGNGQCKTDRKQEHVQVWHSFDKILNFIST